MFYNIIEIIEREKKKTISFNLLVVDILRYNKLLMLLFSDAIYLSRPNQIECFSLRYYI